MRDISLPSEVRSVVFDVGETLVDESRAWAEQAEHVGIPPFTLMGLLGALIQRGEDHRRIWDLLGVQPPGAPPRIEANDLYPDALPCLQAAKNAGLVVGIAGNQPAGVEAQLRLIGFEADFIASSSACGVAKPSAEFFSRTIDTAKVRATEVLYVGDRLDNDVLPAREAGMRTAFIRRGPWGYVHSERREVALTDIHIQSLAELTRMFI